MASRVAHISRIEPHPENARRDVGDVTELAASIRARGLLSPLIVCAHPRRPGGYQLLAGHRRLAACKKLGIDQVPVKIVPVPEEHTVTMLVENCQRNICGVDR